MPYDPVVGSTDPDALDGGVYSPIPNDPSVTINANAAAAAAAAALSALQASNSASASAASASASDASAIAAAASAAAALASQNAAAASASAASTSASNAAASASAAATSAGNSETSALNSAASAASSAASAVASSNSASNSAASASAAAASALAAATSENNAAGSAGAAATSAAAAAASLDSFDDRYLGPKASDPTLDNDGNPLLTGALYFNTTVPEMRVYSGATWSGVVVGVASFNGRSGIVSLLSSDVVSALGYTPYDASNPAGYVTAAFVAASYLPLAGGTMTGALLGAAGAAGTPGFAFAGDANNGWWAPAADTQAWSTAGVERMRLSAGGQLNLFGTVEALKVESATNAAPLYGYIHNTSNTANSAAALIVGVGGTSAGDPFVRFDVDSGGSIWSVGIDNSDGDFFKIDQGTVLGGSNRFVIDTTGNVGIGTAAPSGAAGLALALNGGAGQARLALKNTTSGDAAGDGFQIGIDAAGEAFVEQREALALRFSTSAVERMQINAGGNVGVGVTPTERLHLGGASNVYSRFLSNAVGGVDLYVGSAANIQAEVSVASAHPLVFFTSGTERARIVAGGQLLLGTTAIGVGGNGNTIFTAGGANAATYHSVKASGGAEHIIGADAVGTFAGSFSNHDYAIRTNNTERMRFLASGGVTVSQYLLAYGATPFFAFNSDGGGSTPAYLQWIQSTGVLRVITNGGLELGAGNSVRVSITSAGVFNYGTFEVGYRGIPQVVSSSSRSLQADDRGKCVTVNAGGLTVDTGVFAAGDAVAIYNNAGGNITITQGGSVTLRFGAAGTGNRTLANNGMCTVWCVQGSPAIFTISGSGLS